MTRLRSAKSKDCGPESIQREIKSLEDGIQWYEKALAHLNGAGRESNGTLEALIQRKKSERDKLKSKLEGLSS
ncbi:hypothetical protein [Syntrophomonas curvata]